jgi:hypothetical protein
MKSIRRAATLVAVAALGVVPVQAQQAPAPAVYMNVGFSGLIDLGWSSRADVRRLQVGDHDPRVRGFTIPNAELTLDGAVDPFFKGFVNIVNKLDENGETGVELEEMFLITTALPGNLQFKAGQFFAEFGRQNVQHPHAWAFVDQPLVLNRMFGGEGMRGQGARLSWLLPTPFYTEAMVGVLNSAGETMFSFRNDESGAIHGGAPVERDVNAGSDMVFLPRVASSFDVGNQTFLLGLSGAFGPNNAGEATRTRIVGTDVYWKWKSPTASAGFPFVSVQAEYLARNYESELSPKIQDDGSYAQLLWGIKPRLVAGLRGDFSNAGSGVDVTPERESRTRWSPSMTWYPSEFSKVRFQYNYDHRASLGRDHSVWVQFEFLLGAHAAHRF